ncbi:hypothetical protein [Novipirellula artificiosorum]|uniref:Uncharacterized protein n=1 Tax=Novipirellula artificiosorum TaxID=2528016 RepID=A0A5C6DQN2_9BACT|nr:hypothetical protein [Novipirellula artificiosorum]TWU38484.1 hypothetical protein Poly41_29600 [Novipirellula artificiosorum]
MNENRRTLLLAAGAGAIVLMYFADAGYRSFIEVPTKRLEVELKAVEGKIQDANTSQITGRRLANQLEACAARALPYNPVLARSRYQDWLLKLVEQHKMESASVDAETPRPIEIRSRLSKRKSRLVGHQIGFTLRARTTLNRLTDFLHDFHRSAQLHKIRSFSLSPLVNGNQLDLNLSIETLSLEATEREGGLSMLVRNEQSFPPREQFNEFVNRNLFAKGFSKSLGQVRLNAITQNRSGEQEGWFSVGSPPRTQIVAEGETLDLPLHTVTVKTFHEDRVNLLVNEFDCWITLGETLGDVLGNPTTDTVATSSNEMTLDGSVPLDHSPNETTVPGETGSSETVISETALSDSEQTNDQTANDF